MPDLTSAELARRLNVARSTLKRAIVRAAELHAADPARWPAPPLPVNPGEPQLRYPADAVDAWWPHRPPAGRPRRGVAP